MMLQSVWTTKRNVKIIEQNLLGQKLNFSVNLARTYQINN
jgi:hypothetical protein